MRTAAQDLPPAEFQTLIERRRALGLDMFDEVWEGTLHMSPGPNATHAYLDDFVRVLLHPLAKAAGLTGTGPFNVGEPNNFRVPDGGYHRGRPKGTWVPTAAIVVEVLSPDDESYEKFGFYADHRVDEIVIVDPQARAVTLWRRTDTAYENAAASALLGVTAADLTAAISWPDDDETEAAAEARDG